MTWTELIDAVAQHAGITKTQSRRVMSSLVEISSQTLERHESVRFKNLCTLQPVWRQARVVRSLHNQRKMYLDGRWGVSTRISKTLRERLADQSQQLWREEGHQAAWELAETLVGDLELYHEDKLPTDLDRGASDEVILDACAQRLGPAWRRATRTFDEEVPGDVREERNYLAQVVRTRWCQEA